MTFLGQLPAVRPQSGAPVSTLLLLVRHWRHSRERRSRNLAELRSLDASRLQDIGLTPDARARMLHLP
jgi:uncharacterized protein YjiS (DUF1127 family)